MTLTLPPPQLNTQQLSTQQQQEEEEEEEEENEQQQQQQFAGRGFVAWIRVVSMVVFGFGQWGVV